MSENGSFILVARPLGRVVIRDFFNPYGDIFALLTRPPETRDGSFGLRMAAIPSLHEGDFWEVGGREVFRARVRKLRLYTDGAVIFRTSADESFLCWPEVRGDLIVNPVVVADACLSFCEFIRQVTLRMSTRPTAIEIGFELPDAARSEPPIKMYSGPLRKGLETFTLQPNQFHGVGEVSPKRTIEVQTADLIDGPDVPFQAAAFAAYDLVRAFYDVFGFDDQAIPYVDRKGSRPKVSLEAFAR